MNKLTVEIIKELERQKEIYKQRRKNTYCHVSEMDDCDSCRADHYLDARLDSMEDAIDIVMKVDMDYENKRNEKLSDAEYANIIKDQLAYATEGNPFYPINANIQQLWDALNRAIEILEKGE